MDIVDFVEKVCGVELLEYQKRLLIEMQKMPRNVKIINGRKGYYIIMPGDECCRTKPQLPQPTCRGSKATILLVDENHSELKGK